MEEEGIQVSGAVGRWWDSQILILPKHTSHAGEEGHEASDVCGGAADEPSTEREYAAGGQGPGLKAVIPAVSRFQISARLSAPASVCSDCSTRRGPFTSWDGIELFKVSPGWLLSGRTDVLPCLRWRQGLAPLTECPTDVRKGRGRGSWGGLTTVRDLGYQRRPHTKSPSCACDRCAWMSEWPPWIERRWGSSLSWSLD